MKVGAASYSFGLAEPSRSRPEEARRPGGHREGHGRGGGLELSAELDQAARAVVREMASRDREVRAHEAAHAAVGGHLAGAASFTYEVGPDGQQYAVAGEVPIQMGEGGSPEQRIANARRVRAAALAPADPSGADQAIASAAAQMEAEARAELAESKRAEARGDGEERGLRGERGGERGAETEREERRLEPIRMPPAAIRNAYHQHEDGGSSCPTCRGEGRGSAIG